MSAPASVEWLPALSILATGLVLGALLVWRLLAASRRAAKASASGETRSVLPPAGAGAVIPAVEVRDLAGKSQALLAQLRELEDTAGKRTPGQLARERYALEVEAARALVALEARGMAEAPAPGSATVDPATRAGDRVSDRARDHARAPGDRAAVRGFFWGIGSATGLALLGLLVYQAAKPREAGGSVTGNLPTASERPAGAEVADGNEAQLKAAIARNPDDPEGHLALASLYVERKNWMGVWTETGLVLKREPGNPRALADQSLVRIEMGQLDVAVANLTKAIATDPELAAGYAYLALAYARLGRMKDARGVIAKASKRIPERGDDLRQYLKELEESGPPVAQAGGDSSAPNPHAGVGQGTPAEAEPARRVSTSRGVSGTVDIDPSLSGKLPATGVLFVFVRAAGAASEGPPIAVKRLPATFPAAFELSQADSMMGQPLPDQLLIEARLDEDGDPTTRPPTDPKARLDHVKVGRADVRLVLKRP